MTETTHDGYLVDGRRLRAHPAADCFPLMNDAELEALAADISTNGCRVPVSICDDLILDGRNRALACERAGVPVRGRPCRPSAPGTPRWPCRA